MATTLDADQFSIAAMDRAHRRRQIISLAAVIALSLVMVRLVLAVDVVVAAGLLVLATATAVSVRPRMGLYVLFSIVLFFDGVSADPLMLPARYVYFSLQTTLNVSGAILIPFEMLVLLTSTAWLAQAAMRHQIDFRSGYFGRPVLVVFLFLVFGVVRGLVGGANFNYSFWESRFLFALVLTYVLTTNTIRTRAHVRTLLGLIFVLVGLSGVEAIWRKFALINNGLLGPTQEGWFTHEDVVLWGLLVVMVLAQRVFGGPRWMRLLGPLMVGLTVFAMLISERRAGLIAVMIAFVIFTASMIKINRKAFFMIAAPALLAAVVYLPLFWNNTGTLGQPARALRSVSSPDPRDAASNLWRDLEAINVRATIASDPIMGIGFGRPFLQIVTVPDISFFEFWNYEAHHNVLWIWMKLGGIGFAAFFVLLLTGIARSIWLAKRLAHPELRTFAMIAMSGIVMSLVFCYVDLGFTGFRICILLGVGLGTVGVLDRLSDDKPPVARRTDPILTNRSGIG
jgi:hypothetical protein